MKSAKISSKGQITIPREVRVRLGLAEGDQVEFVTEGGQTILRPVRSYSNPFERYFGSLPHFKTAHEVRAWVRDLRDEDSGDA